MLGLRLALAIAYVIGIVTRAHVIQSNINISELTITSYVISKMSLPMIFHLGSPNMHCTVELMFIYKVPKKGKK